jgi:hypothetical protein
MTIQNMHAVNQNATGRRLAVRSTIQDGRD